MPFQNCQTIFTFPGANLKQLMGKQYFNPIDVDSIFGPIEPLRLENIFYKSKPRFFKRTSSAVWHSPPTGGKWGLLSENSVAFAAVLKVL